MEDTSSTWECTFCTFHNAGVAFKCAVCSNVRGTASRKSCNLELVAREQEQLQKRVVKANKSASAAKRTTTSNIKPSLVKTQSKAKRQPAAGVARTSAERVLIGARLTNVDRRDPLVSRVHCHGHSVIITEYQPRKPPMADAATTVGYT